MFSESFAVAVLTVVLVACILACARKKTKKCDLDTETPLPTVNVGVQPVLPQSGETTSNVDQNLYDDADRAKAASPQSIDLNNYEDLEAGKAAARAVASNGTGTGIPPRRSTHKDMSVLAKRSSHNVAELQSSSKHSLHRVDSAPPAHQMLGKQESVGKSFDRPPPVCVQEDEDNEPPPALPPKTEAAEILYEAGPSAIGNSASGAGAGSNGAGGGVAASLSQPAIRSPLPKSPAQLTAASMESALPSQLSHAPISVEAANWIQKQTKIEEDDGPPPPVPQKTADAELIYGENIPLSSQRPSTVSASDLPPPPPDVLEATPQVGMMDQRPVLAKQQIHVNDDDEEEAAPSLPPKTAGAEELYDYATNSGDLAKRPSLVADTGLDYTEVAFSKPDAKSGASPQQTVIGETGMDYTEVAFKKPEGKPPQPLPQTVMAGAGLEYTAVAFNKPEAPKLSAGPSSQDTSVYADVAFQ
eukprot:scpid63016/ scgid32509/ 